MRLNTRALAPAFFALSACGGSGSTAPPSSSPPSSPLSINITNSTIASGTSEQATAVLKDGSTPSGVTWSSSEVTVASVSNGGMITGKRQGIAMITATSGTYVSKIGVAVVPGPAAFVIIYAGEGQAGSKGFELPNPLCTTVLDAAGNVIIGATVTYTVATGGGFVGSPTSPTTAGSGIATSGLWTLGPVVGHQTVTATSGSAFVLFTATAY